jgi:hypothetical protein
MAHIESAPTSCRAPIARPVLALKENPIAIGRGLNSLNPTHIINNSISTGPQVVAIQPSDAAFLTHSCQPWQKTD